MRDKVVFHIKTVSLSHTYGQVRVEMFKNIGMSMLYIETRVDTVKQARKLIKYFEGRGYSGSFVK